jgi:sulfur carrier protein ThiS
VPSDADDRPAEEASSVGETSTGTHVTVEVHLFANLADYVPSPARRRGARIEVPEGTTVAELGRRLAIPDDLPRLVLVNGRDASPEQALRPDDVVSMLPPLVGG